MKIKNKIKKKKYKSGEAAYSGVKGDVISLAEGERGRQSLPEKAVKQAKRCFTDGLMQLMIKPYIFRIPKIKLPNKGGTHIVALYVIIGGKPF